MNKILQFLVATAVILPGCITSDGDPSNTHFSPREEWLYNLFKNPSVSRIVVDIDHVDGWAPSDIAISGLKENLAIVLGHKDIFYAPYSEILVPNASRDYEWELHELSNVSQRYQYSPNDDEVVIHILYMNGYATDQGREIGGVFFSKNIVAVFPDIARGYSASIEDIRAPHPTPDELERNVLSHEVGHALGLVNNGLQMIYNRLPPIEDDPCQCHSMQTDSPLYYRHQGDWFMEKLEPGKHIPYLYNEDDVSDIRAYIKEDS